MAPDHGLQDPVWLPLPICPILTWATLTSPTLQQGQGPLTSLVCTNALPTTGPLHTPLHQTECHSDPSLNAESLLTLWSQFQHHSFRELSPIHSARTHSTRPGSDFMLIYLYI